MRFAYYLCLWRVRDRRKGCRPSSRSARDGCLLRNHASTDLLVADMCVYTRLLSTCIVGLLDVESEIDHSIRETTVERTNGRPLRLYTHSSSYPSPRVMVSFDRRRGGRVLSVHSSCNLAVVVRLRLHSCAFICVALSRLSCGTRC